MKGSLNYRRLESFPECQGQFLVEMALNLMSRSSKRTMSNSRRGPEYNRFSLTLEAVNLLKPNLRLVDGRTLWGYAVQSYVLQRNYRALMHSILTVTVIMFFKSLRAQVSK